MATKIRKLLDEVTDPSTKAAYSELCFKHARDEARRAAATAPFAVSDNQALTLERLGVTTSPFATTAHTHAADKVLENDCLNIIGLHLPREPVTLIQLKRSKLHLLHRGSEGDIFQNYAYEPKDVLRYATVRPHYCPRVDTEVAVLADTLHFMSTQQLMTLFVRNPKLQQLFATLVLPIEAQERLPSLFPDIYRLEYYDHHFAYLPGGHGGAAYVHHYNTLNWLSTGQIGAADDTGDYICLEKLETKAAHHIMLIQRRRNDVPWPLSPLWVYHASDYVRLPKIFYPEGANVRNAYPHTLIKRAQMYCLSLKAVSLRDIHTKLRQMIPTEDVHKYSTADEIRLANYLLFTTGLEHVCDYKSFLTKGWFGRLAARIKERLRASLEGLRGASQYAELLKVSDPIPVRFTTTPVRRRATGLDWLGDGDDDDSGSPSPGGSEHLLEDLDLMAQLSSELAHKPLHVSPTNNASRSGSEQLPEKSVQDQTLTLGCPPADPLADGLPTSHQPSSAPRDAATPKVPLESTHRAAPAPDRGSQIRAIVQRSMSPAERAVLKAKGVAPAAAQTPEQSQDSSGETISDFDPPTTRILTKHGFTALRTQFDGSHPIQPVFFNPEPPVSNRVSEAPTRATRPFFELARDLERHIYTYQVDAKRATAYMSDVKNGLEGLVLPKLSRDLLSSWVALCETADRKVNCLVIHGAGGAGKSRALQNLLRRLGEAANDLNVITPTVNLIKDWRSKMNEMDPKRFMTFEKACEREGREVTIFDDYGKLPAGYIDAYLAIKPSCELIILTGDQRQSVYHSSNNDAQSAQLDDNVTIFKKTCDYYVNATHRQPRRLANPIRVHAERQYGGAVHHSHLIPDSATVLVPAQRSRSALNDLGRQAYTYSGCQGLTLPHVTVVLDHDTPLCSDNVLYTAFSRASESITFVNTYSDNSEFQEKLEATPYLKTLISGVREEEDAGALMSAPEPELREPTLRTHLPVCNGDAFLEPKVENTPDKDVRELWSGEEKTNLMQTTDPVVQMFPHQQAKDEALFNITIDQRIRLDSAVNNEKSVAATLRTGDLLFEAYADFMRVPKEGQEFNSTLWETCKQTALRTYLSKPKANLVQGAARQDPDFPDHAIALFNKSQWVKKLEKVGFPFKAGQTISAFKQSTVLLTTTMALYLRRCREAHQPENVFIMCEKRPQDLDAFVKERWDFSRPSYTSDYTQYDQSQDAAFLNFEIRKARHFGVPDEVVRFYRFIKTHARTFLGNLAVMRLSGEGPTFDANTECNIAYDALRFQLGHDVNACYAGDDLVRDKVCPERPSWRYSQHLFQLQAKPLATSKPDFCGWRLTQYGIVKSPIQLYQSLELALRLGKMEDVKRSYAIDYLHAYKLGDRLFEIFDEDEMDAHQLITRTLITRGLQPPVEGERLPTFHITSDRLLNANTVTRPQFQAPPGLNSLLEEEEGRLKESRTKRYGKITRRLQIPALRTPASATREMHSAARAACEWNITDDHGGGTPN